jgi:hypothetical protein
MNPKFIKWLEQQEYHYYMGRVINMDTIHDWCVKTEGINEWDINRYPCDWEHIK